MSKIKTRLTAGQLRKNLARHAESLAQLRDEAIANYARFDDRTDLIRARSFRLALSSLHIYTDGEFGQALEDQPEPERSHSSS